MQKNTKLPSVWVVVPCFNRSLNTLRFLTNFSKQDYAVKQVVIVDDGSNDNTLFNVRANAPSAHVIRGDGNLWWAGGTNLGVRHALENGADYVLTINDDAQFPTNLISLLVETAVNHPRHIVGSVIVEEGDESKIWSVGSAKDMRSPRLMRLNFSGEPISVLASLPNPFPVEFMPGNGVLFPSAVFSEFGYYDEVNFPQYHADSEMILRATRDNAFKAVICLQARVINQILTRPLVDNIKDLMFSKKSDLYWPALATFMLRYFPDVDLQSVFLQIYSPFDSRVSKLLVERSNSVPMVSQCART